MGFEFAVPAPPPPPPPLQENAPTKLVNRRLLIRLGLNDYLERSVPNLPKTAAKFSSETQVNSRLQALRSILAVVTGTESALFPLEDGRFDVASASSAFKSSLKHYAEVGTQFRAMLDFTDPEADEQYASRGRTFGAFRVALRATLHQLLGQTVDLLERRYAFKQRLTASEARAIESKISLLEVEFLFEEDEKENSFSNLLLTIRHLHVIFLRVTVQQSFEWPRLYAHQTLQAIAERLTSVPQRRLRSVLFTLLEHCLGPLFTSLEYLLTEWTSMEELTTASAASECLLASRFETDEELISGQASFSYGPTELTAFWADFLHLDEKTFFFETTSGGKRGGRLFGDGFQALIEAIKASFVFRLNGLQQAIPTIAPGALAAAFRRHLEDCCRRYALAEDLHQQPHQQLNLETPYQVTEVPLDCPDVPLLSKPLFKRLNLERFTGYQLPLITELGLDSMLEEALTATYQQIARPINSLFLGEVRRRYLRLLRYYTDFFLLQKVEHLLQYVYRLFPLIRETSVEGEEEGSSSLDAFASQLEEIHRRAGSVDSSLPADFAPVMAFFRPSFTAAIAERAMEEECAAEGGSPHTAHLQLFASLFFVPSFGRPTAVSSRKDPEEEDSEENFYDFWPLQRLFNADVSLLFNRLLQFLLKLRYSQYQLGVEFFHSMRAAGRLQSSSSLNVINSSSSSSSLMNLTAEVIDQTSHHHLQLTRAHYLGRHRLVTAVANIGLSLECRLKEVVGRVEAAIEGAASFDALLSAHQAFLRQVTQLAEVGERKEGFFASTIAATAKFCYRGAAGRRGAGGGGQKGHRFNRHRLSFYQNLNGNSNGRAMNQDEYFDSVQL